jgi:hypothetical protein
VSPGIANTSVTRRKAVLIKRDLAHAAIDDYAAGEATRAAVLFAIAELDRALANQEKPCKSAL